MTLLRPGRTKGRHRKQTDRTPAVVASGMTAAFIAGDVALAASPANAVGPTAEALERLRQCESGGDYRINTGNGYYGAYQFALGTWRGLGYSGYPHRAAPAVQDQAVRDLHAQSGWSPWPSCSRRLGLNNSELAGDRAARSTTRTPVVTTSRFTPSTAPAFAGTVLSAALVKEDRADVRAWQATMRQRGWRITVDGHFGPRSASVAQRFAAQKRLAAAPGTVNAAVWAAAWQLPTR